MEAKDNDKHADRFFNAFVLTFLLIYVGIVLQARSGLKLKQASLNEKARIQQEQLIVAITRQLHQLNVKQSLVLGPDWNDFGSSPPDASQPSAALAPIDNVKVSPKTLVSNATRKYEALKEVGELNETLAEATSELARFSLETAKEDSRSIPWFGLSLPDSLILSLFPLGVFGGLFRIWWYRHRYMAVQPSNSHPPVWAAPLPWGRFSMTTRQWMLANSTILVVVGLTTSLTLDYILEPLTSDDLLRRGLSSVYLLAGALVLALYLLSLIGAVFAREQSCEKSTEQSLAVVDYSP